MQVKIGITAHHNGQFQFRICRIAAPGPNQTWEQAEQQQLSEECFNQVGGCGAGWQCWLAALEGGFCLDIQQ